MTEEIQETAAKNAQPEPGAVEAKPARRLPPRIVLIVTGAAVLVLIGLVAFLRPGRHAAPAPGDSAETPEVAERTGDAVVPIDLGGKEDVCSRPAAGARIAALARADSSYESGDFAKARDLYLDLLLTGGDLGGGDDVGRWAHGRLALCLAKIARGSGGRLLDDPELSFRETPR
jgi:hypothetical protein